jgi:hypothetical protein
MNIALYVIHWFMTSIVASKEKLSVDKGENIAEPCHLFTFKANP